MLTIDSLSPLQISLLTTFCIAIFIQIFYYLHYYTKVLHQDPKEYEKDQDQGVSIIVYSDSDYFLLKRNIHSLLALNYSQYEVIVVNDGSCSEIENLMTEITQTYANVYYSFLSDEAYNLSRKKMTLTLGIKAARYPYVIITKASARPISQNWLSSLMQKIVTSKADYCIAPCCYSKKEKWTESYAHFDKLQNEVRTLSYGLYNNPHLHSTGNILFRKDLFFENKGFAKQMHLLVGEDILFVDQIAQKSKGIALCNSDSLVCLDRDKHNNNWKEEKRIYAFTRKFASKTSSLIYGLETSSRFMLYGAAVALWIFPINLFYSIALTVILITRAIILSFIWHKLSIVYSQNKQFVSAIAFELITPIVNLFFKYQVRKKNKKYYTWKL